VLIKSKQRSIEYDLPIAEISENSAKEKNIRFGHISNVHLWWARRPLNSSRATSFAALIDSPDSKKEKKTLETLIKQISTWESIKNGNSKDIEKAKKYIHNQFGYAPKVLDPFSGGGSIPLEALRLGCETYSCDYNPVAVLIEKASLEWPQKYLRDIVLPNTRKNDKYLTSLDGKSKVSLLNYMIKKWANSILDKVYDEIHQFHPYDEDGWIPIDYIWVRKISCQNPMCDLEIPMIRQYWLAKKGKKRVCYYPIVNHELKSIKYKILSGNEIKENNFDPSKGTIIRGNVTCPICNQVIESKKVRETSFQKGLPTQMVAVVLKSPNQSGKKYRIANEYDYEHYQNAEKYLEEKESNWLFLETPYPNEKLPPIGTLGYRIQRYGYDTWDKIYNPRQKLSMVCFLQYIKLSYNEILEESEEICALYPVLGDSVDLTNAIVGYLGLLHGKMSEWITTLNSWQPHVECPSHIFTRPAIPMCWDYAEMNPIEKTSGSWMSLLRVMLGGVNRCKVGNDTIKVSQEDATKLSFDDNYFDAIFTDPPYYDNIPYSDLSDFFYVWLKRSLGDIFPSLFITNLPQKKSEIVANPIRQEDPKKFFEDMLAKSFIEMYRVLKTDGITTIVYAYKTTKGWETLLSALLKAGFVVTASWPIRTEMKTRLRAAASATLASSIYMVCRKRVRLELGIWNDIKQEIRSLVESKLKQFWTSEIVGGDFFISAIGPGMEVFSKYKRIETYGGEVVSVIQLLDTIRSICANYIISQLLSNGATYQIDKKSQFYLAYRWTYLDNKIDFDDVFKLASGIGISLDDFEGKNGIIKISGKNVSVLGPKDRVIEDPVSSIVDVAHKSLVLWEKGLTNEIRILLNNTTQGSSDAFWKFCQAVSESLLEGSKEKQLLEGFLIGRERYSDYSQIQDKKTKLDYYLGDK
jgi:putative DNA methylase